MARADEGFARTAMLTAGNTTKYDLSSALPPLPVIALYCGTALYLFAQVAFRLRNVHTVNVQRVVVAASQLGRTTDTS